LSRRALALLACAALAGACGKASPGAEPDGGAPDGGDAPMAADPVFNVFPLAANVWPGSFADVKIFFNAPPTETWHLTLGPVSGGAQVTLESDTLSPTAEFTLAHVDIPATSTDLQVTFAVTAVSGARRLEKTAEIGLYRADAATMPGYAVTAQVASVDAKTARFKARVVGYGGFAGRVYLVAAHDESHAEVTFAQPSLMVSGTTPAETTIDEVTVPGVAPQLTLWAAHRTHLEVANVTSATPAPAGTYVAALPRTVVIAPGETQLLGYDLWPQLGSSGTLSIELASPQPGFTIAQQKLSADATAPAGVASLPVTVRRGTDSAAGTLHVSVVPTARAGWALVGGTIAGRDCGGMAVSALAAEVVTFGTAARCRRYPNGAWMRAGDDGSFVSTVTRNLVRYEARQSKTGVINLNVVDTSPNSAGTRFWEVADEKGNRVNAPSAAVDETGQWWLGFSDANGRARAFRKGTVGAGIAVSDGLPTSTLSRPVIASNGPQVFYAVAAPDGAVKVYSAVAAATATRWTEMAGPDATVATFNPQVAMDTDAQRRIVLAWVGTDGKVHVARNAGAWDPLGTYAPKDDLMALDLAVVADRAGEPLIGWRTAAHTPAGMPNSYPATMSGTAIELRRGTTVSATLEPSDPRSPITVFSMALDETDAPVIAEVEGPVTQVLRWVGP
jgi:hypothetical protein